MSKTHDLLIEIGTEELPPKSLRALSNALADGMEKALEAAALRPVKLYAYAAPRRLALLIKDLPLAQPDRETVRRGPALAAAFDDDGCPTQAALGFAKSCGVEVEQLDQQETKKGSWLSFRAAVKGKATTRLIPDLVRQSLAGLPIPRRMRWGDRNEEFVRPVHWVVLLFGDEVIDTEILGIKQIDILAVIVSTIQNRFIWVNPRPTGRYSKPRATYWPIIQLAAKLFAHKFWSRPRNLEDRPS